MNNYEIDKYGNKCWRNKYGQRHRIDGPAVIWPGGQKFWFIFDRRHRIDGPAIEEDDCKEWYLDNSIIQEVKDLLKIIMVKS